MNFVGQTVPVLRLFDEAKAREFYVDFLGFKIDFEHRLDDNAPLYMGISRGACRLHLSGHFGDGSPGARLRVQMDDVSAYCAHLRAKQYRHARPGEPEPTPWGSREITIADPFGNRLTFWRETSGK